VILAITHLMLLKSERVDVNYNCHVTGLCSSRLMNAGNINLRLVILQLMYKITAYLINCGHKKLISICL
jgi:hypothetical protein